VQARGETTRRGELFPIRDTLFAVAAGGVPVEEPAQKEGEPERRGGVADPAGDTWWISTQR
jgi:uncharacterized glyoxalase superfamily protein PhnB